MSVDAEIEEIRRTITEIHRTLYKIDAHLDGAIENVDRELSLFDQSLRNVAGEANRIRTGVAQIVSMVGVECANCCRFDNSDNLI
uniref:t-SNARE coiled-coil homology domain-containing protein n=1 Tax=Ascaris lumbricoides TaxID=6252 RepID=A0A0M3IP51_ASCLU